LETFLRYQIYIFSFYETYFHIQPIISLIKVDVKNMFLYKKKIKCIINSIFLSPNNQKGSHGVVVTFSINRM
jgi:hypothetical protein